MRFYKFALLAFILMSTVFAGDEVEKYAKDANDLSTISIEKLGLQIGQGESYLKEKLPNYDKVDLNEQKTMGDNFRSSDKYALQLKAQEAVSSSTTAGDVARFIIDGKKTRPEVKLDRETDPMFTRMDELNANVLKSQIQENYGDCANLATNNEDSSKTTFDSCTEKLKEQDGENEVIKYVSKDGYFPINRSGNIVRFGRFDNDLGGSCDVYTHVVLFFIDDPSSVTDLSIVNIFWDDWLQISVNDNVVVSRDWGSQCQLSRIANEDINIDIRKYLRQGQNTIVVKNEVSGGGGSSFILRENKRRACKNENGTWTKTCDGSYSSNKNPLPQFIPDSKCAELLKKKCYRKDFFCTKKSGTQCLERLVNYACPLFIKTTNTNLCGSDLPCVGRDCASTYHPQQTNQEGDFQKANVMLNVLHNIAKEVGASQSSDPNMIIFSGSKKECEEQVSLKLGGGVTKKCCPDNSGGWTDVIGLNLCSDGDKGGSLSSDIENKRAVRTSHVRLDKGSLSTASYRAFCVFPTKLAKIITAQGKAQLGFDLGDDCTGLTAAQIQKLNFAAIDFSDIVDDYKKTLTLKQNPEELKNEISAKINQNLQTKPKGRD